VSEKVDKFHKSRFVPSLSSCHEKATVALYFGRIRTCLGVVHFRLFFELLTTSFIAACSKPPSSNHRKAPYPRTQQRVRRGWELIKARSRDHTDHTAHARRKNSALTLSATLLTDNG